MSLLFIDGFDHYDQIRRKWVVGSTFDNPTFVTGRFGGQALKAQFQNNASSIKQSLGPQTELFAGFAFYPPGLIPDSHLRIRDASGGIRASLSISSAGEITLSAGGQTNTSVASTITTAQWHYIEVHYTAKSVGGIFECRVDEVAVALITGDTTTGAVDDIESLGIVTSGTNTPRYLYDDLYICNGEGTSNNTYIGDCRVNTLYPKANGISNNFTPTEATNWGSASETVMDDDTTYVESGLVGAKEDYDNQDFTDKGLAPGAIFGVQTSNATKRTDAGTIKFINEMVIAGIRYTDNIELTPGNANYFIDTYIRDTDPSDDATWTEDKVAAVGSGLTITFRDT